MQRKVTKTSGGRLIRLIAILAFMAAIAAACGSNTSTDAADDPVGEEAAEEAEAEAEPEAEEEPEAEDEADGEPRQVAFLNASSANTWLQSSLSAMEPIAADNNIEIVEFDAGFDPAAQQQQFQDAIASGQFDGVVLTSLAGAGAQPDIQDALDAGLEVVVLNQVIGEDFTTTDSPVDGVAGLVFEPPLVRGERLGQLTVQACEGFDPCNVVYFFGIR